MRSIVLGIGLLLLFGCMHNQKQEEIQAIAQKILVGSSATEAEAILSQSGFSYSLDSKTNTIYAIKHMGTKGLVKEDWTVQVKLDQTQRVTSVKAEKMFTGP